VKLISPFEFVSEFAARSSLAVVGNARSLASYGIGRFIDDHEVIARFNECAVTGFEEQVGSRTDILVTNPYAEARSRPILDGASTRVVLAINPQTRRGEIDVFERWVGDHRVLFTYTPDLVGVANSAHMHGLTTGTYAIQLLWRILQPSQLLVTGFTMFAEPEHSHYWKSGLSSGIKSHDMAEEARIFCEVLNAVGARTKITPDVASIFTRVGLTPGKRIQPVDLERDRSTGLT
jgi:hypothetical protein